MYSIRAERESPLGNEVMEMDVPSISVTKSIDRNTLIADIFADIKGELDTIAMYERHIAATSDPYVKNTLSSIRDEEKVHCGELVKILKYLDPQLGTLLEKGEKEAGDIMAKTVRAQS